MMKSMIVVNCLVYGALLVFGIMLILHQSNETQCREQQIIADSVLVCLSNNEGCLYTPDHLIKYRRAEQYIKRNECNVEML